METAEITENIVRRKKERERWARVRFRIFYPAFPRALASMSNFFSVDSDISVLSVLSLSSNRIFS
jgi:hypothetical protein